MHKLFSSLFVCAQIQLAKVSGTCGPQKIGRKSHGIWWKIASERAKQNANQDNLTKSEREREKEAKNRADFAAWNFLQMTQFFFSKKKKKRRTRKKTTIKSQADDIKTEKRTKS